MKLQNICLSIIFCATSVLSTCALAAQKGAIIKIENMQFSPATLHVKKGEKITCINNDLVPHTVTADDKSFDSKTIEAGKSWSFRANKTGIHPFKCSFHPMMTGSISVD